MTYGVIKTPLFCMTLCDLCEVPAGVGEEDVLLGPVDQNSLLHPGQLTNSYRHFVLVGCKKDSTILVSWYAGWHNSTRKSSLKLAWEKSEGDNGL